ncbi:MAG: HAMP domain-containing histidine kinase [Beijerinckiaceae bacterium]|nr:HAMP domain-containing histidine kinase [Beijerinckiaceae bacterium]
MVEIQGNKREKTQPSSVGVSERLLLLTIGFVMLAEILIYVPSIAAFRNSWLSDRLAAARTAALLIEAAPPDSIPDATIQELLRNLQAKTVTIKINGARRLLAVSSMPEMIDRQFDLRQPTILMSIGESFDTLLMGGRRTVNVVGPAPMGGDFVDIVIDEAPLRNAMLSYSVNILIVSLIVSGITAALLYFTMLRMIVRPVSRLVSSIMEFADSPEDAGRIIALSGRRDEIGRAEEALHGMQKALSKQLKQKKRLARLGLAVSKINHDLRNMLASVQLFSDRLAVLPDPTVQRFAPKLISALDRAISFCQSTLAFGKAEESPPSPKRLPLAPLLEEVREMLGAGDDGLTGIGWQSAVPHGFHVHADPDHLFRILINLGRNSIQALKQHRSNGDWMPAITIRASNGGGFARIDVADNGPGVPPALRNSLFEAFAGSSGKGSTGLGLAIAADLARAHGGSIELICEHERHAAQGAVFRITLPQPHG